MRNDVVETFEDVMRNNAFRITEGSISLAEALVGPTEERRNEAGANPRSNPAMQLRLHQIETRNLVDRMERLNRQNQAIVHSSGRRRSRGRRRRCGR